MSIEKTIRRVTREEQQDETRRYWQGLTIGKRFDAVWEATAAAYAFKGVRLDDRPRPQRTQPRVERSRG